MATSLDELRRTVRDRMTELRPLVAEYEQLERAAAALGERGAGDAPAASSPAPRAARRGSATKAAAARAPRGARKAAVLAVIGERPGVSVAEIASVTGIDKPVIYNVTRSGIEKGELESVDLGGGRRGFKLGAGGDGERPGGGGDDDDESGTGAEDDDGGTDLVEGTEGIEDPDEPAPVGG